MGSVPKVVLVTGGSSGLGAAICARLSKAGHRVYGMSRKAEAAANGYAMIAMDVTDEDSVERALEQVLANEKRIDVVINNAGTGIQGAAEDIGTDTAQRAFDTNFFGVHRVCRAVLPAMRAQRSGLIINISSIAANFGLPYRAFYSASKAALNRYSETLRMETARFGVKVVVVEPGEFRTNIAASRLRPARVSEAYAARYEKAMGIVDSGVGESRDPDELAQVIEGIIASSSPKTIYRVAQGVQKLSVLLKKLLPGKRFERMVAKHYE